MLKPSLEIFARFSQDFLNSLALRDFPFVKTFSQDFPEDLNPQDFLKISSRFPQKGFFKKVSSKGMHKRNSDSHLWKTIFDQQDSKQFQKYNLGSSDSEVGGTSISLTKSTASKTHRWRFLEFPQDFPQDFHQDLKIFMQRKNLLRTS